MNKIGYVLNLLFGVIWASYLYWYYDVPFDFLCGTEGVISFVDVVSWIMLFFPVWAFGLWQYDTAFREAQLVAHRYKKIMKWWFTVNLRIILQSVTAYVTLFGMLLIHNHFPRTMNDIEVMCLIIFHAIGFLAIGAICQLIVRNTMVTGMGLILVQVVGLNIVAMMDVDPKYIFAVWGMRCYSKCIYGEGGYSVLFVVLIQVVLMAGISTLSFRCIKNKLLGRLSNEKND